MISRCRVCETCLKLHIKIGRHYLKKRNFICILCQGTQSIYHKEDSDTAGYSYECNGCHNYIWYSMDHHSPYKEELYFGEWCLVQDYEDNTSYMLHDEFETIRLPILIDISDISKLFDKIKTYIIFS